VSRGSDKTAILSGTVSGAADDRLTMWQCRRTEPESAVGFAGLEDLLDGLDDDIRAGRRCIACG
jgi:hypothetical protein